MSQSSDHLFIPYHPGQATLLPSSLDSLISPSHPVRVVSEIVDRVNLEPLLAQYRGGGRPSYHPRMMLKIVVYAYLRNIYSSRRMEDSIKENIHFMWLSGGNEPDHNSLNRFRSERLKGVLKTVFSEVVLLLHEAGHLDIKQLYTDGTKLEGNANRYTFVWAKNVKRHKERIFQQLEELWAYADSVSQQELMDSRPGDFSALSPEEVSQTIETIDKALKAAPESDPKKRAKLSKGRKNWPKNLRKYQEQESLLNGRNSYSKTDPDATFMRMKEDHYRNSQLKASYNFQLSTHRQFIAHYSLHQSAADTVTLISHLEGFNQAYGGLPDEICTDAGYGSEENYEYLTQAGVDAFLKYNTLDQEQGTSTAKQKPFDQKELHYNQQKDHYVCPMGQLMTRVQEKTRKTSTGYQQHISVYEAQNCQGCPIRGRCHKGKGNRRIDVNKRLNHLKKRAKERLNSPKGIEHRKNRSIDVEATFGILKQNHGMRRLSLRGMEKVEIEVGLYALAHNIRKMIKANKETQKTENKAKLPSDIVCLN